MPKTDDFWWYITLSGPSGMEDALSSVAEDSGCIGSLTTSRGADIDLQVYYRADRDLGEWLKVLQPYLEPLADVTISDMGKIENRPWHTEWMDAFPPLNVGEHLVVMAPWHAGKEESGRLPVYIYPGSAFGTGYHQSTQAVLTLLERYLKKGDSVADIGCGSAILSIAALKMGAGKAYARDLDPTVVNEALRNAMELNGLPRECLDIAVGDLLKGFDHTVDVLMANILFEPNMALLPDVAGALNEGGRAIFSGMVDAEGERFKSLLERNGLRLIDEVHFDDWCGLAVQKL